MFNINKKILVAEDDKFLLRALKDKLERKKFIVVTAVNGVEALERIKMEKPDLILLDLVMPEKDGFEVLEELKMSDQLQKIPVLILSNLGQEADIKKGRELGAIDYIVKSDISLKEVVKMVQFYLAKK